MSQLPRYDSYKDSGVQWLGEIPSHWDVTRLKFILEVKKNAIKVGPFGSDLKGDDFQTSGYPVYNQRTVLDNDFIEGTAFISEEKFKALVGFKIEPFDILVTTRGTIGKIAVAPEDVNEGIIHPCIMKFSINRHEITDQLLKYLFNEIDYVFNQFVLASGTTTIPVIYSDTLKNIVLPLPPITEQKIIVDFLDKRLAQVDALIAKQETLLEKLAEQRVALISHAVTKGLNPDVNLKKSNSQILGSYPETWKVKRLRFDIETNPSKSEIQLDESELVSFIPMESVSVGGGLDLSNERMISEVSSGYTYFADGDVVVAKITPCFENGKASIAENLHQGIAFGTTELHVLRCKENLLNKFLFFIIQSDKFMKYGESEMYGAGGQKRVPERFIKDYLIALPPLDDQQEICDFIESQLSHLDGLVEKVESTISTFNEYRSTLITQVVTGKIDVRKIQIK